MKSILKIKKITPHNRSEAEQLVSMDQELFPWPWSPSQWVELFSDCDFDRKWLALSATDEDHRDPLGFCLLGLNPYSSQAHLLKLVVRPELRKQGLATELLAHAHQELIQMDHESVFLEVSVENNAAIELYQRQGYATVNRSTNFYSNGEDAYCMIKSLKLDKP